MYPNADVRGWLVQDPGGEVVGSIAELVLDSQLRCVRYALVASGGFLGLGEQRFAVPWPALRSQGRHFVLVAGGAVAAGQDCRPLEPFRAA